jgi:hypothetical protein
MTRQLAVWAGVWVVSVSAVVMADAPAAEGGAAPAARPRARQMEPPPAPQAGRADAGKPAYLGVTTGPVSDDLRAHADVPDAVGLVITKIAPGSPADTAGLRLHDILLEFDGRPVASPLEFLEMVEAAGAGRRVALGILRRGKRQTLTATLAARDAAAGGGPAAGRTPLRDLPGGAGGDAQAQAGAALGRALAMAQGGGGTSVQVRSTVVNGVAEHSAVARDRDGTIEIEARAGRKRVSIRGADGREIHAGPLEGKADLDAVPEAWRERVRALDGRIASPAAPRLPGNAI